MNRLKQNVRNRRISARVARICIALVTAVVSTSAWAIPSPDLVINLSASFAQVLGLLSVVFGGFALSGGGKAKKEAARSSRGKRILIATALVLLALSLIANGFQYASEADSKNARLRANLTRPSVENGNAVGDTSLKTLSYSSQKDHPQGVTIEQLTDWRATQRPLNIVDVREPEEVNMGYIDGSWHKRYPEVKRDADALTQAGRETVLICHSGNRSSELCTEFSKRGLACRFLIGGYEKWIAQGNPLTLADGRTAGEIRQIADFANKDVLLDTPDVTKLVQEQAATFVDVRYPGDFALGHLPGAINVPIRMLPDDELARRLQSLPDVPIIAPCYDKRSCFYGSILGSKLAELGHEFAGRYTVPHEFMLPGTRKEYIAAYEEAQQQKTLFGVLTNPLRKALTFIADRTGELVTAIVLLVLLLRALFLPFTAKADRDRFMQRALAPELKELKQRIGDDGQRYSRAVMHRYKQEGFTPVRNLVATLVQLFAFLAFFSVVNNVATDLEAPFLWAEHSGAPDNLYLFPLLVSALFMAFLLVPAERKSKWLITGAVGAGVLMVWLTNSLNIAVNFYLVINLALLLAQQLWIRARHATPAAKNVVADEPSRSDVSDIVTLDDAWQYDACGQKAIRLSQMKRHQLPVPEGFVVTSRLLGRPERDAAGVLVLDLEETKILYRSWSKLGATQVAVRSSGLNEDGENNSYAGVFDSILQVERSDLFNALTQVADSLSSQRAGAYNGSGDQEEGSALIMKMVDAEFAGVLFTEHPGSSGRALVELVSGLGDNLVSGRVTPKSFEFGMLSHRLLNESETPPLDLAPLLRLGAQVEALFGKPQDIEWAFVDGAFHLLQARDITTRMHDADDDRGRREAERSKLLSFAANHNVDEVLLVQNELSELLPRPTPYSASFMERLWASGGSTDLACRTLGIAYDVQEDSPPYVVTVFGSLYVNKLEERARTQRGAGASAAFRLARSAEVIEARFQEEFLPEFDKDLLFYNALDLSKLSDSELFKLYDLWSDKFITEVYVQAEIINVATDFYWKTASQKLSAKNIDPALYLGKIPETVVHKAMGLLNESGEGTRHVEQFLELFGHRAPHDYEFSQPRYNEEPETLDERLPRAVQHSASVETVEELPGNSVLRLAVRRAQRFQVLKEDAKHHCLKFLACIRRVLLEIDSRFELDGGVFYLSCDDVAKLRNAGFLQHAKHIIDVQKRQAADWHEISLPSELSACDLEALETETATVASSVDELRGTRVAGRGEVVGRVHVIKDVGDMDAFEHGEILVARLTDPTWFPVFPLAGGIVTEVGGWLSHAAIVAREFNLTAIVGARGASSTLKTGDIVRLGADGRIEKLEDQREASSPMRRQSLTQHAVTAKDANGSLAQSTAKEDETTAA